MVGRGSGGNLLRVLRALDAAIQREIKANVWQHGLTPTMGVALMVLRAGEGQSAVELSRSTGVPLAAIGAIVAGLLRRGLVRVDREGSGARIRLTEEGLLAASAYEAMERRIMRRALRGIDDAGRVAVEKALRSLLLNLAADPGADDD